MAVLRLQRTAMMRISSATVACSSLALTLGLSGAFAPIRHSVDSSQHQPFPSSQSSSSALQNIYDDWRADAVILEPLYLDEEHVQECLDEFIDSNYGHTMFGCHEQAASVGITGHLDFVELCGPEVTLSLGGEFWHRRETVLGKAAVWLNARMPEISDVIVADPDELVDFEEEIDELSGEVIFRFDKRSPDFNGDREVMEYQGRDPDVRGPFPQRPMGPGSALMN